MKISAGVIIDCGDKILVGHATKTPRWDIFKGGVDEGETFEQAARRELQEEAGIVLATSLTFLGEFAYTKEKRLALFHAFVDQSDIEMCDLVCTSYMSKMYGGIPEMDAYKWIDKTKESFKAHFGSSMARVLTEILL